MENTTNVRLREVPGGLVAVQPPGSLHQPIAPVTQFTHHQRQLRARELFAEGGAAVVVGIAVKLFTSQSDVAAALIGAGLLFMTAGLCRSYYLNQRPPTEQELIRHEGLTQVDRQLLSGAAKIHVAMALFGLILRGAGFPSFNGSNTVVNTVQGTNFLCACLYKTLLGIRD